ncbi:hypothetical protein PLEOSDRAFT_1043400, partial [Pleurotus ostreatus PC15]
VVVLYSKTGGKNARHASQTTTTNIAALSYIGLQVYQYSRARQFHNIPMCSCHQWPSCAACRLLCLLHETI